MEVQRDFLFATEIFKIELHNFEEVNRLLSEQYNASQKFHTQNLQKSRFVSMEHIPAAQYILLRATAIVEALTCVFAPNSPICQKELKDKPIPALTNSETEEIIED